MRTLQCCALVLLLGLALSGCADYACAPARWQGYSCPSGQKTSGVPR